MAKGSVGRTDNRRQDIEAILDSHGIKWEYAALIALEDIVRHDESQSRLRTESKDLVGEYAEKMKRGAIFPPIIVVRNADGTFSVVDGNTRCEARRKRTEASTDAYIIEVADANEAVYVSAIFNASHGAKLNKQEVVRAVLAASGMAARPTDERLAQDYGVGVTTIRRIINGHRVTVELEAAGIDTSFLRDAAKQQIAKVRDVAVKRDLAKLVIDADLSQADLSTLVKEVNLKDSEVDRLAVVSQARADREAEITARRAGRIIKKRPIAQQATVFGRLSQLIGEFPDPTTWVPQDEDRRKEMEKRVNEVTLFLDDVRTAYGVASAASAAEDAA